MNGNCDYEERRRCKDMLKGGKRKPSAQRKTTAEVAIATMSNRGGKINLKQER